MQPSLMMKAIILLLPANYKPFQFTFMKSKVIEIRLAYNQ
jgi:hypothetical protein